MIRLFKRLLPICAAITAAPLAAAPFQSNSLIVTVFGGGCSDNTGCPVGLAEFDLATGQLRQTIPLPATASGGNRAFTLEESSAGQLARSADGRYLTLAGFSRPVVSGGSRLSTTPASEVQRVVARIDAAGVVDTSTTLGATGFSQVTPTGAATVDGSRYWVVGGNGGVRYVDHAASDSLQISGTYAFHTMVAAADNLLWMGTDTNLSRVLQMGTLPATTAVNQAETLLTPGTSPGLVSRTAVSAMALMDVSPEIPGVDLIYAAHTGDLVKYRKNATGGWDQLGRISTVLNSAFSVASRIKPGTTTVVQVYFNARCASSREPGICLVEDASGFNGTMAGTADSFIPPPAAGGFLGVAMPPVASAGTAFAITPGITGAWFDPQQAGHGLFVEVLPGNQFLAWWFTFSPTGEQSWFGGVGPYTGNVASVPLTKTTGGRFIPNFNAAAVTNPAFGSLTFTYTGCNTGKVEFDLPQGYGRGSMTLTRLTLPAGLSCQ